MFVFNKNNTVSFSLFTKYPQLVCTFSLRNWGNLNIGEKPGQEVKKFVENLGLQVTDLIVAKQQHTSLVKMASENDKNTILYGVDGLVTSNKGVFLTVKTADCVPLFFFDPVLQNIATAHAGWRGTLLDIGQAVLQHLQEIGSKPEDILVAVGPHIGACCYNVSEERATDFVTQFGRSACVASQNRGEWFLDIGQANRLQLVKAGIREEHIDAPIACTSCQSDLFFSYRRDTKDTFGEMLGIIGVKAD